MTTGSSPGSPVSSVLSFKGNGASTLDFDIEARPLSWYGGDYVTREITAIAARWIDQPKKNTAVWLLGVDDPIDMLEGFRHLYDLADIVTGHYIRGFDLPNLNAAYFEYGLPGLGDKYTVDTKLDLVKRQGMSSSQENLAAMLGLDAPKIQMDQAKWRSANRLEPEGIALTRERAVGDVHQHIEMLAALRERKMLTAGKVWTARPQGNSKYQP